MDRLSKYIYFNFSTIFFSIFIPLFSIASLIFFIKIVSITSIVKINFFELLELYLYVLPQILFWTISITFFAATALSLSKLSYDYEMIVIFSLGIKPFRIAHIFGKIALLTTITLSILSFLVIPQAKQTYKSFIAYKKSKAIFNIKPSELGQKFGDWFLFIDSKNGKNSFKNVVLYSQKDKEEFINAKEANIVSNDSGLKFLLKDGYGYSYKDGILQEIKFKKMILNDLSSINAKEYKNIFEYWMEAFSNKKRAFDFTLFATISIFPIVSIFLILSIGIINPRFQKNRVYLEIVIFVVAYYFLSFLLSKHYPFYAILIIASIWFIISYILYAKRVKKRY